MPGTTIESFVDDIAKRSNIDPAAAETAVGTILSVILQEGNPSKVSQLFDHLPGAAELAQKYTGSARIWCRYWWDLERSSRQTHRGRRRSDGRCAGPN